MIKHRRLLVTMLAGSFLVILGFIVYQDHVKQYPNPSFQLLNGNQVSLHDFHGKPVVILFWASTYHICLEELPSLNKLYKEITNDKFELIAVSMPYDPPNRVVDTVDIMNITFPVAIDIESQVINAFRDVSATPTTIIISPQGRVITRTVGEININNLHNQIMDIISRNNPATT